MRVIVIGASAAGLKAACRAKRLMPEADITVIEKGQYISYSACGLPYFLSGDVDSFRELTTTAYDVEKTPEYFADTKGVEVLTGISAEKIDRKSRTLQCVKVDSKENIDFKYDKLVIAAGAEPIIPNIPGIDSEGVLTFTKAEEAIQLRKALETRGIDKAAVIGGGFIGCELAEAFSALWGVETALFELQPHILAKLLDSETAIIAENEIRRNKVELHLNSVVKEIKSETGKLTVTTEAGVHKGFDRVIAAVGVKPNALLAKNAGLKIGETGGIKVNEKMQTSDPNIFAAGDCVELVHAVTGEPCHIPLGSLANRMGRTAGNSLAGEDDYFAPVSAASCLKIFDLNIASVGITAQAARKFGFKVGETWGVFTDKLHYYPEYEEISVKLVYNNNTGRILGVQALGKGDVIRRIDAVSTMIKDGKAIDELLNFEPAYAPPYATALDPLHFLAYGGMTLKRTGLEMISPAFVFAGDADSVILDVREEIEFKEAPAEIACRQMIHIPITQLRNRINELPKKEKIIVICQRGSRSSEAGIILQQNGFKNLKVMGGGLSFFHN